MQKNIRDQLIVILNSVQGDLHNEMENYTGREARLLRMSKNLNRANNLLRKLNPGPDVAPEWLSQALNEGNGTYKP